MQRAAFEAIVETAAAVQPEALAARVGLHREAIVQILDLLEKRLMFLYRDGAGAVEWCYPATAASTPHTVSFSAGRAARAA